MMPKTRNELFGIPVVCLILLTACGGETGAATQEDSSSPDTTAEDGVVWSFDTISTAPLTKAPYIQAPEPNSVVLRWETDEYASTTVEYSVEESYGLVSSGSTFQIDTSSLVPPVPPPVVYQHEAVIGGLAPGTTYHYRVISVDEPHPAATFETAPAAGDPFSFVVFGSTEMIHDFHALVLENIAAVEPDFLLHTGDLVEQGSDLDQWQTFFDIEAPLLASTPLFPTLGDNEAEGGQVYFNGFFQLGNGTETYYAFDYGDAHFIVLDSNLPLVAGAQADWLHAELEKTAAATPRFLIVSLHEPIFTFSHHPPNLLNRQVLQPLFEAYGVDAVFSGHNHCYEHFLVNDVRYVVTGGGGAPLHGVFQREEDLGGGIRLRAIKAMNFVRIEVNGAVADVTAYDVSSDEIIETFEL